MAKTTITITLDTDLYNKYKSLLDKEAWKAAKITNLDYEELRSRANLIFCEATKSYDPTKGAFSTHLVWQLKKLAQAVNELRAPNSFDGDKSFWVSLEQATVGKDGDELTSDPIVVSVEYANKMEEALDDASWEARLPDFRRYMDAMDCDTKTLCNDILDGQFEEPDIAGDIGRKAYIRKMSNIPVTRYYNKRYIKLGWSKARVQNALNNLRQLVRQWQGDKIPCSLIHATEINNPNLF